MAVVPSVSVRARSAEPVGWQPAGSLNWLARFAHKTDFFALSNHFIFQDKATLCGPVSSVTILKALCPGRCAGLPKDRASIADGELAWLLPDADPFHRKCTPNNVFTGGTNSRLEALGKPIPIWSEPRTDFGFQQLQFGNSCAATVPMSGCRLPKTGRTSRRSALRLVQVQEDGCESRSLRMPTMGEPARSLILRCSEQVHIKSVS